MPVLIAGWLVLAALVLGPMSAQAQIRGAQYLRVPDSSRVQVIKLGDGSSLMGRIVRVGSDSVYFQTSAGLLPLARASIAEIREVSARAARRGQPWPADPNPTRLYFGPTARTLPKGEAHFSDTYLFLPSAAYGVTDRLQLGGGLSVVPLDKFTDNVFFATAKLALIQSPNAHVAVGGLVGWSGTFQDELGTGSASIGVVYGVGTFGTDDHSITLGAALPFASGIDQHVVIQFGGETRLSRRLKLVTENYFVPGESPVVVSYGLRIFGERLGVDLAFLNSTDHGVFPGLPYVDFVVRF